MNGKEVPGNAGPVEHPDESAQGASLRGAYRFRPHERLHRPAEYARVKAAGKRCRTAHFGLNFAPNALSHHRLGIVVQKRFWGAVGRNRIKRILREWFRHDKNRIPMPGKDIVVIARPGAEKLSPRDISKECLKSFGSSNGRI
jgi:ribonuclease P protein component